MKRLLPAVLLLSACASPNISFSSKIDDFNFARVAVSRFDGPHGGTAADFFAHALLDSGADVVERKRLEALLREQKLSVVGALDPMTVKRVGRLLGVDALFFGAVTGYSPPRSYLVFTGTATAAIPTAEAIGGSTVFTERPALGQPGASILTSAARVGLTARLVEIETGSVVWSAHQTYEGFDLDSAMASITRKFARSFGKRLWQAK